MFEELLGAVKEGGQILRLNKLQNLVDEYVGKVRAGEYVDDDTDHYIFEAAVELFYGKLIWNELNEKLKYSSESCM